MKRFCFYQINSTLAETRTPSLVLHLKIQNIFLFLQLYFNLWREKASKAFSSVNIRTQKTSPPQLKKWTHFNFGLQVKINSFLRDEQETKCHFPWAWFHGESGELCPQVPSSRALPSQGRAQPCPSCKEPPGRGWLLPRASSSATASLARRKSSGLSFSQRWDRAWGGNVPLLSTLLSLPSAASGAPSRRGRKRSIYAGKKSIYL